MFTFASQRFSKRMLNLSLLLKFSCYLLRFFQPIEVLHMFCFTTTALPKIAEHYFVEEQDWPNCPLDFSRFGSSWLEAVLIFFKTFWTIPKIREIKPDVTWSYVKRQTAKMKLFPSVFRSLNSRVKNICICGK